MQALFPNGSPLNLQILSGVLNAAGHEVKIADLHGLPPGNRELFRAIDSFKPDIIGFSNSEIANASAVIKAAAGIKKKYPGVKLLAGGQTPTFMPELFLGPEGPFDAVALYEAEATICGIVEALASGKSLSGAPGAAWRGTGGRVERSAPERSCADLDKLPFPYWEGTLRKGTFSPGLAASMETSRGCPYRCVFCSIPGFYGATPRYKSASRIMEELRHLKSKGVTEVYFIDDSFATRPEITRELFNSMISEKLGLRFLVQVRADVLSANPDLAGLGARAGLFMAVVGFEGYTAAVQREARKGNSAGINREASKLLRRHGVAVYGTHVFGGPESGLRDNLTTFAEGRRNSDLFRMTIFTPLPGSRLYSDLAGAGGLGSNDPSDFYEGKYLIKGSHNPTLVSFCYFALQALHYALPDTIFKAVAHPNKIIRTFHRRAYYGSARFVLGSALTLLKGGRRKP